MAIKFNPEGFKAHINVNESPAFKLDFSSHTFLPGTNNLNIPKNSMPSHLDFNAHFSGSSHPTGSNLLSVHLPSQDRLTLTNTINQNNQHTQLAKLTIANLTGSSTLPVTNTNHKTFDPTKTVTLGEDIQLRSKLTGDPTKPYAIGFISGLSGAATSLKDRATNYLLNEAPIDIHNSLGQSPVQLIIGAANNQASKARTKLENVSIPNLANIDWASAGQNAVHFIKNPNGLARTAGALTFETLLPDPSGKAKKFGELVDSFFNTLTPRPNLSYAGAGGPLNSNAIHHMAADTTKTSSVGSRQVEIKRDSTPIDPRARDFDKTMNEKGWGLIDTRGDISEASIDTIVQRHGAVAGSRDGSRLAIRGIGEKTDGPNDIILPPNVQKEVNAWAEKTLNELRTRFPNENLVIANVDVGRNFHLQRATDAGDFLGAHVDQRGTYFHATNTLRGPSSLLYPDAKLSPDIPNQGGMIFSNSHLKEFEINPPTGTTAVFNGGDRKTTPSTVHSSPPSNGEDRITLFLNIQPRDWNQ